MTTRLISARHLFATTAVCVTLAAMPVHAADTAADTAAADAADAGESVDGKLTDIIVTAQKRETNLQKTPISISVLGARDIENRHIKSMTDLIDGGAPGLRVTPYASRPFSLILNIRGVGIMQDTNQPAADSGVGVYIDGVFLGRPQGLNAGLNDIESIEVLKGPQGTLFGRNTEGGALNIVTRKPTGEFHLRATAGAGNFGGYEGEIHLDLPEWHNLSVKVDAVTNAHDGYVKNPMAGATDYGSVERRGVRAQVQWRPAPNFTANYAYDASHEADGTLFGQTVDAGTLKFAPLTPALPDRVRVAPVGVPLAPSIGRQSGHALNLKWEVSPALTIKSISSYRELYQNQFQNAPSPLAFTPNLQFARYSLAVFDQYQYSQELQAIGSLGRVDYVVGALAYHEHVRDQAQAFYSMQFNADGTAANPILFGPNNLVNNYNRPITNAVTPLFPYAGIDRASKASTTSYGVYGQATWTPALLDDSLHLTGGLRWTNDNKKGDLFLTNNALPVNEAGVTGPITFTKSWSRFDPMVNLAIDLTHDVHVYGKWSTGYRSGGANSRSLTYKPFGPESISMFEIGAKTEFLDHHARFNVAAYTGIYKNYQFEFSRAYISYDANGNPLPALQTARTTSDTTNIPGNAHVRGVETELTLTPFQGLTLTGSYTYNYVRIPATPNPFPVFKAGVGMVIDPTPVGIHPLYTPEHSATGAIDYEIPLPGAALRAHLDANWNGGYYTTTSDPTSAIEQLKTRSAVVFNARLSLADIDLGSSDAKLSVSLWARNLFNEAHLLSRAIASTRAITGSYNEPRTFGVQGSVRF